MTEQLALENLSLALANAIANDEGVKAARLAFAEAGLKVAGIEFSANIHVEEIEVTVTANQDADFLRSLRIAPDLTPPERPI